MSRIFITGDTHGDIDFHKLTTENFPVEGLTRDDYVIVCGDMGIVWGSNSDRYMQKWWESKPWTTLFVDGNHENFHKLYEYPVEEWHGGKIHRIMPHAYHLMRGQIFDIDGHSFFAMGGAASHDKWARKLNVSWWEEELPSEQEIEEARRNLAMVDHKVDYIITHCLPASLLPFVVWNGDQDSATIFLEEVFNKVKYKHWYCGHYHKDVNLPFRISIMYQSIKEIIL